MRMLDLIGALFAPAREERAPWLERAWIGGLFLAGLGAWAYVMGWGRAPLDFHDWSDINVPRLSFLQNALRGGDWPLHMAGTSSLHGVTDRFLSLPDVITSPQALLLLIMTVPQFVLADVLLHFAAGFAGLLLLRRHFQWSLFAFSLAYLLFLFNGHILAHYSVGHFTWGAYFLFPFVALLLLRFLDGDASWRSIAQFAAVMFYMVLSGGQHHMTWVLLLLGLPVPFCWTRAWWLVAVVIASGLLSAVRLLPPALELGAFKEAGLVADVIGFPSMTHLIVSLVQLRRETPAFVEALPGNMWFFDSAFYEFTVYIGAAGFALLAFGLYLWVRAASPIYRQLVVPVAIMTAFSLGSVFRIVRALSIPLLDGERYTARMFCLPLFLMIVMAVTALDRELKQASALVWHRVLATLALMFLAIDMAGSARLWRVAVSSGLFGPMAFDRSAAAVANHSDPAYSTAILAGLVITLATAAVLLMLAARERQRNRAMARVHTS
jgi:multisubunit Na+/H+ antiporter MnhC subunit